MTKLEKPCKIKLIRLSKFAASRATFQIFLNGSVVGSIKNGETIELSTDFAENELTLKYIDLFASLHFDAKSGGIVEIQFSAAKQTLELV